MTTLTLADVEARHGLTHLDHLDRDAALPTVRDLPCAQGDVLVRPAPGAAPATEPIPATGVPVVRGENGGNTHLLVGDGAWRASDGTGLVLGTVTVPEGGTCLLSHPEHGGLLFAPGTFEVRRQREQADEIRMVAD